MIHLFRKNDKTSAVLGSEQGAAADTEQASAQTQSHQEPVMSRVEMESLIREEAKRQRLTEHILSAPHLQRIKDTLKLNETKFANVEENLMRTREQKDRLRRYKELQGELELQRTHLFEVNKLAATMLTEKKELDRFETFENVQGRFQRLQILERQRREEKQHESALMSEMDQLQHTLDDEQKRLNQCNDEARDCEKQLSQGQAAINNAIRLEGKNSALAFAGERASEHAANLQSQCAAMEKDVQEQTNAIEQLKKEIEKKRTRLQSTEAHQRMTEQGELVVEQLGRLHDLLEKGETSETKMKEAERNLRSENDLLRRVFSQYQQIEAQIKTTSDELHVHRESIHGQDSYQLQERAMRLKRRRQMLKSAQALWHRIQSLYALIEDKQQQINSLRLHQEHTTQSVRTMEMEIGILRRSTREKEYTFTLSKSQNVIQLRSDLKEGVSCTVCGATHHPYHSDTMLEQNKLIGELKTEAELLQTELHNKENELLETKLDLERTTTARNDAENELITLRSLQNDSVKDWAMYAELDPTFHSCDSSTNAEARTAMLRQLIENIETDVQKAQNELDNYNFHQSQINELSETMGRQEQQRSDLTTRMNEVNTSCQVLSREVEWLSARKQELSDAYGRLFERLDKVITLPDWENAWKHGHESTLMRIQELTAERNQLTAGLADNEHTLQLMLANLEQSKARLADLRQQQQLTQAGIENLANLIEENNKELERLLHGMKSKQYNDLLLDQFLKSRQKQEQQQQVTTLQRENFLLNQGRLAELKDTAQRTDLMATTERSALDVWIRQYNASHSPVQYSELEHFFEQERDWTNIRGQIRATDMDALLTQAKLEYLKSQMVALQAEGNIPDGDVTEALLAMAKQEEVLEKRRMDAMLLIATNTLTLQAHEKAEAQIKSEKMKER